MTRGAEGTCWAALNNQECAGGSTSSCLYSFPDDGGVIGRSLVVIGVHPSGLALANRILYTLDDDGQMAKIPLGTAAFATTFKPNLAGTTKVPIAWLGAASTSANQ